jgi:hypothetical protein
VFLPSAAAIFRTKSVVAPLCIWAIAGVRTGCSKFPALPWRRAEHSLLLSQMQLLDATKLSGEKAFR